MLKPAKMQRIAVVGLREERQRVVTLLYDLGVVQIEPVSKSAVSFLQGQPDNKYAKEVSEELLRIRSLKTALPPTEVQGKTGFASIDELMNAARGLNIDTQVSTLKQEQERLTSQLDNLRDRIDLVTNLDFIREDLGVFDLQSAASFFGLVPASSQGSLLESLRSIKDAMVYTSGDDPIRVVVVVPNSELEQFGAIVQRTESRLQRIPSMRGTPAQVLEGLQGERTLKELELEKVNNQLQQISLQNYAWLSAIEEQLSIEGRKLEVVNSFGFTENAFVLEGWVPDHNLSELQEALTRYSSSTILFKIESDEKPPTLMVTPKRLKFFESFTRILTPPQVNEFDPTLIFAAVFPIFFGLMLGDVGYGLVILAIALWIKQRVEHPERKTLIPAGLRRFAKTIFQPIQFRKLAMAMIPGAILGIVFGFLFNAYFGFHFNQYLFSYLSKDMHVGLPSYLTTDGAFLDPLSTYGLKTLLLFSGYTGLFFVSLGLVMGMINKYWEHENRHIVGKLGWIFVAWGIVLLGLLVLHEKSIQTAFDFKTNPETGGYVGLIIGGILLIAYGEGGQALIELPSIVSHILSFTRLTGILLASIGFALVINNQFEGLAGHLYQSGSFDVTGYSVGLAIAGIILLVVGQLFNIVLALFEPGIQGARLLFVEFFSKFYEGQAKLFAPFKGNRTHTLKETELMQTGPGNSGTKNPVLAPAVPAQVPSTT